MSHQPRVYRTWDYVTNEVVEWNRSGECNRCGACCDATVTYSEHRPYRLHIRKAGGHTTDGKGTWCEIQVANRWRHFFRLDSIDPAGRGCSGLQDGNGDGNACDEYETRSWICREWPFAPACVTAFPECSYRFTETGRWRHDDGCQPVPAIGKESNDQEEH